MINKRSSGILAHITSLPSTFGVGDIGPSSYRFIDFLVDCDQSYWQFLPTGPIHKHFDYSPYMSSSAFAGSFLLISPEHLFESGLISETSLSAHTEFNPYLTDYAKVENYKKTLLEEAFDTFRQESHPAYLSFLEKNSWLEDYALFMTAKELYPDQGWFSWPHELATRSETALHTFKQKNNKRFDYYRFEQFEFFRQWQLLRNYAKKKGIQLFGDLPIYVSLDSVDVWANQQIFALDRTTLQPTHVAGVPPDYFSETGQRWGNPLYDWQNDEQKIQDNLLEWWTNRLAQIFTLVDIARVDHFRAFESYWSIANECKTAIDGKWVKGPGKKFFEQIFRNLGPLPIVAEDLGIITPEVEELRDELEFPGMKVLQFAFDGNPGNSFLPHNFTSPKCIVYTGTHDNDTTLGWFMSDKLTDAERDEIKLITHSHTMDDWQMHHALIYLAQSSISMLSVFPLQDILGFGGDCKMNSPGTASGNWRWRCGRDFLNGEVARKLKESTRRFNRGRKD